MLRRDFCTVLGLSITGAAVSAERSSDDRDQSEDQGDPTQGRARSRPPAAELLETNPPPAGSSENATAEGMPQSLHDTPRSHAAGRWLLGVHAYNTTTGVVVSSVAPSSPAHRAGFERGDTIVTVNGYQVGIVGNVVYYLGDEIQRHVRRRGRVRFLVRNWRTGRLLNVDVVLAPPRYY